MLALISLLSLLTAHADTSVELRNPAGGAKAVLVDKDISIVFELGKTKQQEESLGAEFIPVEFKGKPSLASVIDLDGDGSDELLVRVGVPPQSGALWVFRYDPKSKRYAPVPFEGQDFISVDYAAPVKLDAKGSLEIRLIQRRDGKSKKLSLQWKGGAYAR